MGRRFASRSRDPKTVLTLFFLFVVSLASCSSNLESRTVATTLPSETAVATSTTLLRETSLTSLATTSVSTGKPSTTVEKPVEQVFKPKCSGGHKQKTGTFVNITVEFECLLQTENFEIYFNPTTEFPLINTGKTDEKVVKNLANSLENAFEDFGCPGNIVNSTPETKLAFDCVTSDGDAISGMGLQWPKTNANGRIIVTLGGAAIPAQGYSRQIVIQFEPYDDSSRDYSTAFVYHEAFHQFQWAYTDDGIAYLGSQDFIESMADFATAKALKKATPCLGDAQCLRSLQDRGGNPWSPAYDGEYWFEYLLKFESGGGSVGELLDEILRTYDDEGQDETAAFTKMYGADVFDRFEKWALPDEAPKTEPPSR